MTMETNKRYDEALARARNFYEFCKKSGIKNTAEIILNIFPELRERDDERIREELIKFFSKGAENNSFTNGVSDKDILAWLEKQGEQKSSYSSCESDIDFKIETDKWYVCIKDYYYSDIDELMFTKGKAYKAYVDWGFICNNGTKKTPIGMFPYKEYFRPATAEEIPYEQKPTDKVEQEYHCNGVREPKEATGVLKQLLNKENYAWSEEDEVKINRIVTFLENLNLKYLNVAGNDILLKVIEWLKSLKDRYTWIPSKENNVDKS